MGSLALPSNDCVCIPPVTVVPDLQHSIGSFGTCEHACKAATLQLRAGIHNVIWWRLVDAPANVHWWKVLSPCHKCLQTAKVRRGGALVEFVAVCGLQMHHYIQAYRQQRRVTQRAGCDCRTPVQSAGATAGPAAGTGRLVTVWRCHPMQHCRTARVPVQTTKAAGISTVITTEMACSFARHAGVSKLVKFYEISTLRLPRAVQCADI